MSIEAAPLDIGSKKNLIDFTVQAAPKGLIFRELLRNAIEASIDRMFEETTRIIRFGVTPEGKLFVVNTGVGMDADELIHCTNLASSGPDKEVGFDGRQNRGEGAKISTLRFNREGMRYRSRKDGEISEVFLYWDDQAGWSRMRHEIDGEFHEVWEPTLTDDEIKRYQFTDGDFTEVVLYGNRPDHNTAFDPYDLGGKTTKLTIAHELFGRFYDFPDIGIPIIVQFSEEFRAGAGFRDFFPIASVIRRNPAAFEFLESRFADDNREGISIEYIKVVLDDQKRSPYSRYSQGANGGRAAIMWRGEMYAAIEDSSWSYFAAHYGLVGMGNEVSVIVHLPDDYPIKDDRYRKMLQTNLGEEVTLEAFKAAIIRCRPQWLIDLIEQRRNESSTSNTVDEDLSSYAAKLASASVNKPKLHLLSGGAAVSNGGANTAGTATGTGTPNSNASDAGNGNGSGSGSGSLSQVKPKSASPTNKKPKKGVPKHRWTSNIDQYPSLNNRGAVFIPETAEFILNQAYPLFSTITSEVEKYISTNKKHSIIAGHPDLPGMVEGATRNWIAKKVGMAILLAEHHRKQKGWSDSAVAGQHSPEALTSVFGVCLDDVPEISRKVVGLPEFKTTKTVLQDDQNSDQAA